MPDFAGALGASKAASALLVLFIPSKDRHNREIAQPYWVEEALNTLGTLFAVFLLGFAVDMAKNLILPKTS